MKFLVFFDPLFVIKDLLERQSLWESSSNECRSRLVFVFPFFCLSSQIADFILTKFNSRFSTFSYTILNYPLIRNFNYLKVVRDFFQRQNCDIRTNIAKVCKVIYQDIYKLHLKRPLKIIFILRAYTRIFIPVYM